MLSNDESLSAPRAEGPEPEQPGSEEGRADPRLTFLGYPVQIRRGAMTCSIRMRDLSCGGASGLCDEPLDVGFHVTVCFAKEQTVEAEVRWVRLMNVGLRFTRPLPAGFVRRLHQAHGTFVTTRSR